jgi:hypothetical protein
MFYFFRAFAFRKGLRTLGNNTTNRIERFFLTVKIALRGAGNSIAKRYHLTECIELVMETITSKAESSTYHEFINTAKVLKLHDFPVPEIADSVGQSLTLFASKVVRVQSQLYLSENYIVESSFDAWTVENVRTKHIYDVQDFNGSLLCSCYTNCSFGIPCRHILTVRKTKNEPIFNLSDVLPKWLRKNNSAPDFDFYQPLADAALRGIPDEDILDPDHPSNLRDFTKLGNRYRAAVEVTNDIAREVSAFGEQEFAQYLKSIKNVLRSIQEGRLPVLMESSPQQKLSSNLQETQPEDETEDLVLDGDLGTVHEAVVTTTLNATARYGHNNLHLNSVHCLI